MPSGSPVSPPAIALTGATGFLGRRLVERFARKGLAPLVLGRQPYGQNRFELWDAEDESGGGPRLDGIETIVHAAAHVPADMNGPDEAGRCMAVNAIGTLRLLQAAREAGVRRFVLVSTAGMFGWRPAPVQDDELPQAYPRGASGYLASKLAAEAIVAGSADIPTLIMRSSSIYGAAAKGGFISLALARLSRDEPLTLHGGGRHSADFVHVDDVAGLVAQAALSGHTGFLNAGSGVAHDLLSVVETIRRLLPASRSVVSFDETLRERDPTGFAALSTERAQALFGYRPRPLQKGLSDTLKAPLEALGAC